MKDKCNVERPKIVPPDGGYGWIIASAMAFNSFLYFPLTHCFGLIFKDTFTEMGLSAAQGSLIINLHAAFGMLTGLLNGVILKMISFRKAAFLAAIFYFLGLLLTSYSTTFTHFIICYGVIASLGVGITKSSYNLALNTYFKKRRHKAMAFAITITGFGSIIMPQLINLLMKVYTSKEVIFIMAGICANFFVTAALLQPVKWHMKKEEEILKNEDDDPNFSADSDIGASHLNLEKIEKDNFLRNFMKIFDFHLLKDPIFVNILVGLSLANFSELNFTILIPFILKDFGLSTDQIATFFSTAAAADILFRFVGPYIGDYFKKTPRFLYIVTLIQLVALRFLFLLSNNFSYLLLVAAGIGIAKGVRRVFMSLIVPAYVSLEKLPTAQGMEMMINGFFILNGGIILGVVRDFTGSYTPCIIIMNFVTSTTVVMWLIEAVIVKYVKKKKKVGQDTVEKNEEIISLRKI